MSRKLGEALARRNELQTRVAEIRDRLRVSALVQEGDDPPEDPQPLLHELDEVARELERLIANINRINSSARLASGMTLTQALVRRDVLGLRAVARKCSRRGVGIEPTNRGATTTCQF